MANGRNFFKLNRDPIDSKYAGDFMNQEIAKRLKPVYEHAAKLLAEYVKDWSDDHRPTFGVGSPLRNSQAIIVNESEIAIAIVIGSAGDITKARLRWAMVDTEGRTGGAEITPKKTRKSRNPRTPGEMVRVPMPIAEYTMKTGGGGSGRGDVMYYAWKVKQGAVEPQFYSDTVKKAIAGDTDSVKKNSIMWRAIRNGYRAAGRKLSGNPNF